MKEFSSSAERNRHDILPVLADVLPERGLVLEIASGSGQHAEHFARHLPNITWQPTDCDEKALSSIAAYRAAADLPNLRDPVRLDVEDSDWPLVSADAIVAINMLHISAWSACEGLMAGARRTLTPGAALFYYGPMLRHDRETAPSNLEFSASLAARNPAWGVRQLERVHAVAAGQGLELERVVDMPNHNVSVVWRRT